MGLIKGEKIISNKGDSIISVNVNEPTDPIAMMFGFVQDDRKLQQIREVNDIPFDELKPLIDAMNGKGKSSALKF